MWKTHTTAKPGEKNSILPITKPNLDLYFSSANRNDTVRIIIVFEPEKLLEPKGTTSPQKSDSNVHELPIPKLFGRPKNRKPPDLTSRTVKLRLRSLKYCRISGNIIANLRQLFEHL